jgi:DNA-binding NarL/FixJ family response regulator
MRMTAIPSATDRKTASTLKVSIIEDNRFVRAGWLTALNAAPDIAVLGSFESCEQAFSSPDILKSDLVLLDIGLPGMSGIEGAKYLHEHAPGTAVVMCTVYEDEQNILDALFAGAVGYLLKGLDPTDLLRAIREAVAGGSPMTPNIARKVIASFQKSRVHVHPDDLLADPEKEVLQLLAEGKSYQVIAQQLFLSVDGVGSRIRKIYQKLQAHTRGEAVARGLARHLIHPPK